MLVIITVSVKSTILAMGLIHFPKWTDLKLPLGWKAVCITFPQNELIRHPVLGMDATLWISDHQYVIEKDSVSHPERSLPFCSNHFWNDRNGFILFHFLTDLKSFIVTDGIQNKMAVIHFFAGEFSYAER